MPIFSIWIAGEVMRELLVTYGDSNIAGQEAVSNAKAETIYQILDAYPEVYQPVNHKSVRSRMNVCFRVKDVATEKEFLKGAEARMLQGLNGSYFPNSMFPLLSQTLSFETRLEGCLLSRRGAWLATPPQTSKTDPEILGHRSVGGIR